MAEEYNIKEFEQRCVLCDATEDLVLHHKRYGLNLTNDDFVVLCRSCHAKIHIGGKGRIFYALDLGDHTIAYVMKDKYCCQLCLDKGILKIFDSETEFAKHFATEHYPHLNLWSE